MNYVLVSIGIIPDYIKYTINTILSVDKNAVVHLATDQNTNLKNVNLINLNEIESIQTLNIKELDIYKETIFEKNPLWLTSLLRVFYLRDLQNELGLREFIHFDNDILIYKSFDEIEPFLNSEKFNITPSSNSRLIFGYSFIPNFENYQILCSNLEKIIFNGFEMNWAFNSNTPPNEMDLLGMLYKEKPSLFALLPNLPYSSKTVFDPLSYGQYIDGSHTHPRKIYSRKSINFNDTVGVELYSKRIVAKFKNHKPRVYWENKEYELTNLHIHSKRFSKFLPNQYRLFT